MERGFDKKGDGFERTVPSTFEEIVDSVRQIAASNARAPLYSEEATLLFLQSWWSKTYNRPLKDPLLKTYTLEELLYEFFDKIEREAASKEKTESDDGKIEAVKEKQDTEWADAEEKRDAEEAAQLSAEALEKENNEKWMAEQMALQKEKFGDDFGEDLNFSEE